MGWEGQKIVPEENHKAEDKQATEMGITVEQNHGLKLEFDEG